MSDSAPLKKVKAVVNYRDLQLQRKVFKDEIIEVSSERAKELSNLGIVVIQKSTKKPAKKAKK